MFFYEYTTGIMLDSGVGRIVRFVSCSRSSRIVVHILLIYEHYITIFFLKTFAATCAHSYIYAQTDIRECIVTLCRVSMYESRLFF